MQSRQDGRFCIALFEIVIDGGLQAIEWNFRAGCAGV